MIGRHIRWGATRIAALLAPLALTGLVACGGGSDPEPVDVDDTSGAMHAITGTVSGLKGAGLVLQNNGGDDLAVASGATAFAFAMRLAAGADYAVAVKTPPGTPPQACTVGNGSGRVGSVDVTDIVVTCTGGGLAVGGQVSGLGAGKTLGLFVLSGSVSGSTTIASNGAFTLETTIPANTEYELVVNTQPAGQTCAVMPATGASGTQDITDVVVTCADNSASAREWTTAAAVFVDPDPADSDVVGKPGIAFDAAGRAIAVWEAGRPGSAIVDLVFSRYTPGAGWNPPAAISPYVPIDLLDVEKRLTPRVAMAANGEAVVLWRQLANGNGGYAIKASFYSPATGWSTPQSVWTPPDESGSKAETLRAAFDGSNRLHVAWDADTVMTRRWSASTGWGERRSLSTASVELPRQVGFPELAVNAAGQAVLVWGERVFTEDLTNVPFEPFSARYDPATATWGDAQPIESGPPGTVGRLQSGRTVMLDDQGVATTVWAQSDGTRSHVMFSRQAGSGWSTPAIVDTDNDAPQGGAFQPLAVVDGSGVVTAFWIQHDTTQGHYIANRYVPGVGWGAQQVIGEYGRVGVDAVSTEMVLAANAAGDVVAAWTFATVGVENVLDPYQLFANEYAASGARWGVPSVISVGDGQASLPALAMDPAGNAAAVWKNDGPQIPGIAASLFR